MALPVVSLYAALLALVGVALGGAVGQARIGAGISLGDGGNETLIVRNRRHMNFVENVPLALILLALFELNGGDKMWAHVLGGTLLVGRLIHPFGLAMKDMRRPARLLGALATMIVVVATSVLLLIQHFG